MKGCFVLQRRFAYIGHYVARLLQENHPSERFCGIAYTRQSLDFLRSQTDVSYSTLLLDEEIHARYQNETLDPKYIDRLEREYGLPSLWPCLAVDRVVMSNQLVREYPHDEPRYTHEEMLRLLQVYAKALTKFLDEERPDYIFFGPIGSVSAYLLYRMAKKRDVKTFVLQMSSTRNRYVLSETFDTFTGVNDLFNGDRSVLTQSPEYAKAMEFLTQFREKPLPYFDKSTPALQPVSRRSQLKFLNPAKAAKAISVIARNVRDFLKSDGRDDYSTIRPWDAIKDLIMRKTRNIVGLNDLYDAFTPDDEDFVFFPLHYEPEISLLLQASTQTDQLALIRHIARSLPVQYKLYVKDHPEMTQYRPRAYYKALKKHPNVKLIDAAVSSFAITPKTNLVATITGSTGWEAVMLKKPVISFGHQFYNELSMVSYCGRMEDLPQLMKEKLNQHTHNEEELIAYLTALFMDSAELNLHHLWMDEPDFEKKKEGVRPVAVALAKKLGLV
jgi:hypothetical protein